MTSNYYKILEIDKEASSDDIKRSYRRLSLKYHPDKNANDPEKTEKFKLVTEAYEILSDPNRKRQYDMSINQESFNYSTMGPGLGSAPGMMSGMDFDNNDGINYMNFMNNMSSSGSMNEFLNMVFSQQNSLNETSPFMSQNQRRGPIPSIHRPRSIKKFIDIEMEQSFTGCVLPLEINRWITENNMRIEETETLYINIPKGVDNNELIVIKSILNT